jgi:hypothetical protein
MTQLIEFDQEQFINKPIKLIRLAEELGLNPGSIKKTVIRRHFIPFSLGNGNGQALYLSYDDAELFKQTIIKKKHDRVSSDLKFNPITHIKKNSGVYLIEIPSYSGVMRLKIGWTDRLSERIAPYRSIVPDLRVLAFWPTTDTWCERAALKCAEKLGIRVHQELFECDDNASIINEINRLFSIIGITSCIPEDNTD